MPNSHLLIEENTALAPYTTLKIGGPSRFFILVRDENQLLSALSWAKRKGISFLILGGGSNILFSDQGFTGLVIKNEIQGIKITGNTVSAESGVALSDLVAFSGSQGLGGLENLAGIPGTVAGAIFGNAGAYGQTVSNSLKGVRLFDGEKIKFLTKKEALFSYRESLFKRQRDLIILSGEWRLSKGNPIHLKEISSHIMEIRRKKYSPHLLCPGSFFKNILVKDLPSKFVTKIPLSNITYGKVSAGYFLTEIGARGKFRGGIGVADYHGNLFFNRGDGTAAEFRSLVNECQLLVREKFGIQLEPEVQLVGKL